MSQTIDNRTKIGLFVVMGAMPLLATTVFFVAMIYFKAEATEKRVDRQSVVIQDQREILVELRERSARIEERSARMEVMLTELSRHK